MIIKAIKVPVSAYRTYTAQSQAVASAKNFLLSKAAWQIQRVWALKYNLGFQFHFTPTISVNLGS